MYWHNLYSPAKSAFGFIKTSLSFFCFVLIPLFTTPTNAADKLPVAADNKIILATSVYSPLVNRGKPFIDCAFRKMGKTYQIQVTPWKRAQIGTEQGKYDGFFMASRNFTRDAYATFSLPFLSIKWLYVLRNDTKVQPGESDFNNLTFAANLGSARLTWLTNKYNAQEINRPVQSTLDPAKTLQMLVAGRYDVALENDENFNSVLADADLEPSDFKTFTALIKPLAIYFGNLFLEANPGFLTSYNKSMADCLSSNTSK